MKFSKTKIAQAVGTALALCAGSQAFALNASTYNEATQITLNIGGGTAVRPGLINLFKLNAANNGLCNDGTLDIYQSANGLQYLALCTGRDTVAPLPSADLRGTRIVMHKSDDGGSGNGVGPLVRTPASLGSTVAPNFWNLSSTAFLTTTNCTENTTIAAAGSFAQYVFHSGCPNTPTVDITPDAGISDLEPPIFKDVFSPSLTGTELGALGGGGGISAVIFGIPVSTVLRDNLQRIQFATSDACHPDSGAGHAAVAETVACMPSMTYPQLAALYSQVFTNWSSFVGINGNAGSTGGHTFTNGGDIVVCRRVPTSGTQAVFETQILAQRCVAGVPAFVSAASDLLGTVTESSGSSGVQACLKTANTAGNGAIGILSMEFAANTSGGTADSGYRYLKINGVAPCLLPTIQSKYQFLGESTLQWRTASVNGIPVTGAKQVVFATDIRNRIGSAAVVQDLNTNPNFNHGFCTAAGLGTGALVGNATTNTPPTPPFVVGGNGAGDVVAHPVLTKTRGALGVQNSCGPLIDINTTQAVQ